MNKEKKQRSNGESAGLPKILSQEQLKGWWPFQRVCGKSLEKLHRQHQKKVIAEYEESPV